MPNCETDLNSKNLKQLLYIVSAKMWASPIFAFIFCISVGFESVITDLNVTGVETGSCVDKLPK